LAEGKLAAGGPDSGFQGQQRKEGEGFEGGKGSKPPSTETVKRVPAHCSSSRANAFTQAQVKGPKSMVEGAEADSFIDSFKIVK
jgi:hypothetical protein